MRDLARLFSIITLVSGLIGCDATSERADILYDQEDTAVEVGRGVEIIYSDSAVVRVRVTGPTLHNFLDRENPRQEFPEGIKMEFLTPNKTAGLSLPATAWC
jgi:hypothetical protein